MEVEPMRIAVLGPGGIGGLFAALLARAGNPVVILAGDSTRQAIDQRGLRLESAHFGDFQVSVQSAARLEVPVDACLVTVKNTHLEEALERVPAAALAGALVVPFLNGIDHVDLLRGIYPPGDVAAATIRVSTSRVEPGLIRHASPFASVEIAPSAANADRVGRLAAALEVAGFDVRLRDDERAMLWDKLSFLAPLALLTTHERAGAGVIRTRRREETIAVISEVAAVAATEGVAIDPGAVVALMDSVPEEMRSSMQVDQAEGRTLELDAIGGTVVRRAALAGVAVPVTAHLLADLQARAGGHPGSVRNQPSHHPPGEIG
jgi:2-dehydropantoate 2-reductase